MSSNPLNITTFDFSNVLVNAAINIKIKNFRSISGNTLE